MANTHPSAVKRWNIIFAVNLGLSALLVLLSLTNLSFPGTWPNLVFPFFIGLLSLVLLGTLLPSTTNRRRGLAAAASLPALGCGCLPALFFILLILPPFTLAFAFAMDEMANEQHIQSTRSPDGTRVAEVYFRGVGAYTGGNGRVNVRVRPRFFPLIEWEVYSNSRSGASEGTTDYISWQDNQTLLISEGPQSVPANRLYFDPEPIVSIPLRILQFLFQVTNMPKQEFRFAYDLLTI